MPARRCNPSSRSRRPPAVAVHRAVAWSVCSYCSVTSRSFSRDDVCLACATSTAARASCSERNWSPTLIRTLRLGICQLQLALLDVDGLLVDVVLASSPIERLPAELEPGVGDVRRDESVAKRRGVLNGEVQIGQVLRLCKRARVVACFTVNLAFLHLRILPSALVCG